MPLADASALDSLVGLFRSFFDGVPDERLLEGPEVSSEMPDGPEVRVWLGGPCMSIAALGLSVLGLLALAEGLGVFKVEQSCWPNSAVSTSAGAMVSSGLGGPSVMEAVELGVMGMLAEVSCWLASAVSSSCTGVTETLPSSTASNTEKYGKSAGTSDSSSDLHPVPLLLSLSMICLHLFFKTFSFPLHCATVR